MKGQLTINFNWTKTSTGGDVELSHSEMLQDIAETVIADMMSQGYNAGELRDTITDEDETETEYNGWWELQRDIKLVD